MSARPPSLAGYEVTGELGRGAMGVVWAGVERRSGRTVAIKVVTGELAVDVEARLRFRREVDALRGLRHENVVTLLDAFPEGPTPCMVMERLDGGSLADLLRRAGRLDPARVALLGAGVARGLHAVHELGLVHRDLKPGNVLLGADGTPRVADFGLVRSVERSAAHGGRRAAASLTATGVTLGTPEAMAPEQVVGGAVDRRTDVWALGVLLHQLLVGHGPFPGLTGPALFEAILHAPIPPPSAWGVDVPRALERLVLSCLEREPALRPATAQRVAEGLDAWRSEAEGAERRASAEASAEAASGRALVRPWRRRRRLVTGLTLGSLLALVAAAGAVGWSRSGAGRGRTPPALPAPGPAAGPPPPPLAPPRPPTLGEQRVELLRLAEAGEEVAVEELLHRSPVASGDDALFLVRARLRRGRRDGDRAALERALAGARAAQLDSMDLLAPARALEGWALVELGDHVGALTVFLQVAAAKPALLSDPPVAHAAVDASRRTLPTAAVSAFGRSFPAHLERAFRDPTRLFEALARSPLPRGADRQAIDDRALALVYLARARFVLGEEPLAGETFDRAVAEAPGSFLSWLARGEWRLAVAADPEGALSDLERAAALAPRGTGEERAVAVLAALAQAMGSARRGQTRAASEALEGALGSGSFVGPPALTRALEAVRSRLQVAAEGQPLEPRELLPAPDPPPFGAPDPRVTRARRLLETGRPREAIEALDEALAAEPELAARPGLLGLCFEAAWEAAPRSLRRSYFGGGPATGDWPGLRPFLERVARLLDRPRDLDPALAMVLLDGLARVRAGDGDAAGAREAVELLARTDPSLGAFTRAQLALAEGELEVADAALTAAVPTDGPGPSPVPRRLLELLRDVRAALALPDVAARTAALEEPLARARQAAEQRASWLDPELVPWLEARRGR